MTTIDVVDYANECPHCSGIVTHIIALRKLVRPARDLGLEVEQHLGAFMMETDKHAELQDLMARCLAVRSMIAAIAASAQVPVRRDGDLDDGDDVGDNTDGGNPQ